MKRFNYFFISVFLTSQILFSQEIFLDSVRSMNQFEEITTPEPWKVYKDKNGVSLKYRWMLLNEASKTRQLFLSFKSSQKIPELLKLIKQPDLASQWNNSIRNQQIFEDTDSIWVSHTVFAIPYPLNQQDLVVKNTLKRNEKEIILDAYSVPNHIEKVKDTKRQQFYVAQWRFAENETGETDVKFSLVSMSKSAIPRFIRDPIVLNRLVNSFIELKNWKHDTD